MNLRPEVQKFAEEMERQLRANEHKGGWGHCRASYLKDKLNKNLGRLCVTHPNNREEISRRCANIANFAMMIADNFGVKAKEEGE